jgi:hypothetical protein
MGYQSKYPPAKPGALFYEPLKAAGGVANAAPDPVGHLKVAHQPHGDICHRRLFSSCGFALAHFLGVHVIYLNLTSLDSNFLLLGQFPEHTSQMPTQFSIQGLPAVAHRNKNGAVFGVTYDLLLIR